MTVSLIAKRCGKDHEGNTYVNSLSSAIGAKNPVMAFMAIVPAITTETPLNALKILIARDLSFNPCCFLTIGSMTAMYLPSKVSDRSEGRTGRRSAAPNADLLRKA